MLTRIDEHRAWLQESGEWQVRERLRAAHMVEGIVMAALLRRISQSIDINRIRELVQQVGDKEIDPYDAVHRMIDSSHL